MGTGRLKEFMTHPDVRIAAICDVDGRHRDAAVALVQSTLGYTPPHEGDFRRVLVNKDIDAVAIQTPDHWHAIPTVRAIEAGKDVFVEKPLTYSVAEGRAMADASLRHARVTPDGQPHPQHGPELPATSSNSCSRARSAHHRVQCWNAPGTAR